MNKEKTKFVDNYECAKEADRFKAAFIDPLRERIDKAEKILSDPEYKWDNENQKNKAAAQLMKLQSQHDTMAIFHTKVMHLIQAHENTITEVSEWYAAWRNKVSYKGKQSSEMMESQAEILQDIFSRMYKVLEDLNLEIEKPQ